MTKGILNLMGERRQYRNKDNLKYNAIHRMVLRIIKEAKEQWLQEKCTDIKILQAKYDSFNLLGK